MVTAAADATSAAAATCGRGLAGGPSAVPGPRVRKRLVLYRPGVVGNAGDQSPLRPTTHLQASLRRKADLLVSAATPNPRPRRSAVAGSGTDAAYQ